MTAKLKAAKQKHLDAQREQRVFLKNQILDVTQKEALILSEIHESLGGVCSPSHTQTLVNELLEDKKISMIKVKKNNHTYRAYMAGEAEKEPPQRGVIVNGNVTRHEMDLCEMLFVKQSRFLRAQKKSSSVSIGSSFSMFNLAA